MPLKNKSGGVDQRQSNLTALSTLPNHLTGSKLENIIDLLNKHHVLYTLMKVDEEASRNNNTSIKINLELIKEKPTKVPLKQKTKTICNDR